MNAREKGFLLLSSRLGDPDRKPLTPAQLRMLTRLVSAADPDSEDRQLTIRDLASIGCARELAQRVMELLEEDSLAQHYCARGKKAGCTLLTRVSPGYPALLRQRLGEESPGCLWAKGDISLLEKPAIALVGSRDLREENAAFAREVGRLAARKDWVLLSGNARGSDRTAQNSCLEAGGRVISIVADNLREKTEDRNILYLSEDGFEEVFSTPRALSRNRIIHGLAQITFVAQSTLRKGGTWSGTVQNLRHGWSTVICFRDGSQASAELEQLGAWLMDLEELGDFSVPFSQSQSLFDI